MQKLLFIITALVLSSQLLAAKTYSITLRVESLATHTPLSGMLVTAVIKKDKVPMGQTDAKGELVVTALKEKSINFIITDPSNAHREHSLHIYNPTKADQLAELGLRLNRKQEAAFFKATDAKYPAQPDLEAINENDLVDATFDGGIEEFQKYIFMNLEFPDDCIEMNIHGKVYLSFRVQKDGTITHVVVEKSVHPSLDAEATRVLRYAPKWNPATSNGKPVVILVKMPIVFNLN
jgi:TonB family protein